MYFALRNTDRRGRSGPPAILSRMRWGRLRRSASRERFVVIRLASDLAGLAGLAEDLFAGVPDPLALVGLRLALRADVGRGLADKLLVGAEHAEAGRGLDPELDAGRRVDLHRM